MPSEIVLPQEPQVVYQYVLSQEISALALIPTENGHAIAGSLIRLPPAAKLDGFGQFFDNRSVLVRFDGAFYIVFKQDLFDCSEVLSVLPQGGDDPNSKAKRQGATG